ncbi:hypothetical protein GJAV_G00163380 [Gymnothorax javanicus]|nr:hypothetical protein GJAV_G00163380 [Gymnothorax javanicus]
MKIKEVSDVYEVLRAQRSPEDARFKDDSPRLDCADHRADPVPAYLSRQRDREEQDKARDSPQVGGLLISQLLEEEGDPQVSPRFYAFGNLDDSEVPPSPPNDHSFVSRQRSWSLGSCEDDRRELTPAQVCKKINYLKRKIRKFEERFEEEHKYRPSHSDKAENPEVFRWMNHLSKLLKDLKEQKLRASEEDLTPLVRQRSNTLPKSFGSQLERKPLETSPPPAVESMLETLQSELQEKRDKDGRPEDIKDMTREQIVAEKLALQKALLYYESIHGRPVTKNERLVMRPLYDRYRLVKQILSRACTIPVIGSPSSKQRSSLLQPIIEGVPALFSSDIQEEEDGSEEEGNVRTEVPEISKPENRALGILDHLENLDSCVALADELTPSKQSMDMTLSNLHSASMPELVEELLQAREEKKRIRKKLREFEDTFFRQNGRNIQQDDHPALAEDYSKYKHIKAKLRLLEVLIIKRDSSNVYLDLGFTSPLSHH